MQFEITNRWAGKVQVTAEIEADESAAIPIRIGLAVRWAVKSGAYLIGANLRGAYLEGARTSEARTSKISRN
jgi:uncharacterized protein YjbI with pentapeptide repeats